MFTEEGYVTVTIDDKFEFPKSYPKESKLDWALIHKVPWTGPTSFRKRIPGLSAEAPSTSASSTTPKACASIGHSSGDRKIASDLGGPKVGGSTSRYGRGPTIA